MDPAPFGKYLLLDRIAAGGMAEVFCAKTYGVEGFERLVAIKRILPNLAEDREFINMFVDEARIAVLLGHPNIVPVYELGRIDDMYYIAMEYVAGKDLRLLTDRLRKAGKRLPLPAAAYIICQICDGLDFAHRKADTSGRPLNLVHRDVSPQNILIGFEGLVKITDFGIAMAESRVSEKTQSGILKGKFSYMSPEQVRGQSIDRRADVFAVGILLYELVLGRRLFYSKNDLQTLELVRDAQIPPPREIDPALPAELEVVMLKALASDPDQRYSSAAELHDDLQRYLIVDQSIYSAKTLARYMEEEFAQEMATSTAKLEALMQAPAPHAVLLEARSGGPRPARPAPVVHSGGHDVDTPLPRPAIDGAGGEEDEITDRHTVVFASDAAGSVADDHDVPLETLYQDTNVGRAPVPMDDPDSASGGSTGPSAGARRRQSGRRPAQVSVTAASPIEGHPTAALDAFEESALDEGGDAVARGPRDRKGLLRVDPRVERRDPSDRRTADRRTRPRSGPDRRAGDERRLSRGVRPPSRGKHTRNIALVVSGVALAIVSVAFIAVLRMPEKPSSLVVTSAPISRVEISVDGKVVGNHTPFSTVNLTPGEHTLVVTAPGYVPNVRTFTVAPGKAQVIAVDLEAAGVGPGDADGGPGAEGGGPGAAGAAGEVAVAGVAAPGQSRPVQAAAVGERAAAPAYVPSSAVPAGSPDSGAENAAGDTGDDERDDGDTSAAADTQPGDDREPSGAAEAGAAEAGAVEARAVDVGVLTVHSRPAGAHIWYRGKDHGRAPQTVAVERGTEATVGAHMPGYTMTYAKVLFGSEKSKAITITLHGGGSRADASDDANSDHDDDDDHGDADDDPTPSAKPANRSPAPPPATSAASPGACDGSGAFLSVSAPGASNCKVTVGGRAVGTAPLFKRASPAGTCKVSVVCEGGKRYEQTTTLSPGASEKVIIRDDMWQ